VLLNERDRNRAANANARAQSRPETSVSTAPVSFSCSSSSFASRLARTSSVAVILDLPSAEITRSSVTVRYARNIKKHGGPGVRPRPPGDNTNLTSPYRTTSPTGYERPREDRRPEIGH